DGAPGMEFTCCRKTNAEVMEYFSGLSANWDMQYYTVDDFVAEGNRVVAIGSTGWRNRNTGMVLDTPKVDVWTFDNGKAVGFREFYDTAKAQGAGLGQ
ncbi:MAG: nuclear transport factor 2 family protein, partial [Pseudomonadota bacterium]